MRWIKQDGMYFSEGDLIVIRKMSGKWTATSYQGDWLFDTGTLKHAKEIAEAKIKTWEVY